MRKSIIVFGIIALMLSVCVMAQPIDWKKEIKENKCYVYLYLNNEAQEKAIQLEEQGKIKQMHIYITLADSFYNMFERCSWSQ
jgi:hypothetical protein